MEKSLFGQSRPEILAPSGWRKEYTMSTLNPGEMTWDRYHQLVAKSKRLEKDNWKKHFEAHPEQLQPGAKVCREVPISEVNLSAILSWCVPSLPDKERIDF